LEKRGAWLSGQLVRGLVFGVLSVGITVAMESLGAFRPIEFMPLAGTETEGNQNRE
jgi:hypothetical protein